MSSFTRSHINLELTVGLIRTMNKFHFIGGGSPSYHVLFGRTWIHLHKAVPFTYHQCVKAFPKGNNIYIYVNTSSFQQGEAHFSEAASLMS